MAYQMRFDGEGLCTRFQGIYGDRELTQLVNEIRCNLHARSITYLLNDFLACEGFFISADFIKEIADAPPHPALGNRILRIATVTTNPDIIKSVSDYLMCSLSPHNFKVFHEMGAAREWCRR